MPKSGFVVLLLPLDNSVKKYSIDFFFCLIIVAWIISNYLHFPVWKSALLRVIADNEMFLSTYYVLKYLCI